MRSAQFRNFQGLGGRPPAQLPQLPSKAAVLSLARPAGAANVPKLQLCRLHEDEGGSGRNKALAWENVDVSLTSGTDWQIAERVAQGEMQRQCQRKRGGTAGLPPGSKWESLVKTGVCVPVGEGVWCESPRDLSCVCEDEGHEQEVLDASALGEPVGLGDCTSAIEDGTYAIMVRINEPGTTSLWFAISSAFWML